MELDLVGFVPAADIVGVGRCVSNVIVVGADARLLFPASSSTIPAGIVTRTSPSELPRATSKVKLFGLTLFRLVTTGLPPLAEPVIVMSD